MKKHSNPARTPMMALTPRDLAGAVGGTDGTIISENALPGSKMGISGGALTRGISGGAVPQGIQGSGGHG